MQGKNRFMPVHKPHPMNSVVRDNYYDSENPRIVWNELREGWEVFWYETWMLFRIQNKRNQLFYDMWINIEYLMFDPY